MLTKEKVSEMSAMAFKVREHILRMSTDGGCFTGASMSCADLIIYLYRQFLNVHPDNFNDPNRDYLLLSKGHDVPALYGAFVEMGWMEAARLKNHLKSNDSIYWHPNRNIPGIEFHSGSLGHLPSVGLGIAYDCRLRGQNNKVVVILGDGECNEGSVWETMLVASAKKMSNIIFVIDRNHFQANMATEELVPLEPMEDKFKAFGCEVVRVNGHDFEAMDQAFKGLNMNSGKPKVVIADTVRGKGCPSIEARADRWFCNFNHDEVEQLIQELHGAAGTTLTSETLTVR